MRLDKLIRSSHTVCIVVSLLSLKLPACSCGQQMVSTSGHLFHIIPDIFYSAAGTQEKKSRADSHCALLCIQKADCRSATYRGASGYCGLNVGHLQGHVPQDGTLVSLEKTEATLYMAVTQRIEWHVVFTGRKSLHSPLLSAWNDPSQPSESSSVSNTSYGCLTVDGRLPCNRFFRSSFLNQWTDISKMMVAMYTAGERVAWIDFDGSGASSWNAIFKMPRITDSSIHELVNYNGQYEDQVFSFEGTASYGRRFYVLKFHQSCHTDQGWFFVSDLAGTQYCDYELYPPPMQFRYSTTGHAVTFQSGDLGYADTFAVFVKL